MYSIYNPLWPCKEKLQGYYYTIPFTSTDIRDLALRKLLAPDIHRIEGLRAVRAVFKQVFIRLRLLFHHP